MRCSHICTPLVLICPDYYRRFVWISTQLFGWVGGNRLPRINISMRPEPYLEICGPDVGLGTGPFRKSNTYFFQKFQIIFTILNCFANLKKNSCKKLQTLKEIDNVSNFKKSEFQKCVRKNSKLQRRM